MNWLYYALIAALLWGIEKPFTASANLVHGFKITLAFQAVALTILAFILGWNARGDFSKVTIISACNAAGGAIMSALALYCLLKAFTINPHKIGSASLVVGTWPVVTLFAVAFVGQQDLTLKNLIGALVTFVGLVIITL